MTEAASHWDQLHNHRRVRPQCPNDHVVRFLLDSLGLPENRRSEEVVSVLSKDIFRKAAKHRSRSSAGSNARLSRENSDWPITVEK
jgi:hypothetical protein